MAGPATRLPTYFISHGGGPWPWIKDQMPGDLGPLERSLQAIPRELGTTPEAVLVISGHWEAPAFTVQTSPAPPMVYDYGGFPEFTYHIQYPAPGSPAVAARVGELLDAAGLGHRDDPHRGFDHGTFAPLYVMYPEADVPVLQLSMVHGYDPELHLAAGRALAPLRDEGVLIIGSGFMTHGLPYIESWDPAAPPPAWSRDFDAWAEDSLARGDLDQLFNFRHRGPAARYAHPTADHFVPLFVTLGAASDPEAAPATAIEGYYLGLSKRSFEVA